MFLAAVLVLECGSDFFLNGVMAAGCEGSPVQLQGEATRFLSTQTKNCVCLLSGSPRLDLQWANLRSPGI